MQDKTHYIAVTGIIKNAQGKYLICKRSPNEKVFPNKWCVPGGKVQAKDFTSTPKDTNDHWFDIFEKVLKKEVQEETGITGIKPVSTEIFDIGIHRIPAIKDTPAHDHYDVRFLFSTTISNTFIQNHESKELKWFSMYDILPTNEPSVLRMMGKWRDLLCTHNKNKKNYTRLFLFPINFLYKFMVSKKIFFIFII